MYPLVFVIDALSMVPPTYLNYFMIQV